MAKASKKATKNLAASKAAKSKTAKAETTANAEVLQPTVEEIVDPAPVQVVEQPTTPPAEPPKRDINPEPVVPEAVEPELVRKPEMKEEPTSISNGLNKIADGDRMDRNHAVDLMKMIHAEYVTNPATPTELGKAMKRQFDAMALVELMYYNAQVESDMQQLGIKINKEQFEEIEKLAKDVFGMKLKALPAGKNDKQLTINFSQSVPEEAREIAKKDVEAQKETVPDPDPKLPNEIKLKSLRTIFSHVGGGIGNNLKKGIDWGRIAFGFKPEEKKAVTLANILKDEFKTTLTNGLIGMISGKLNEDHSIIGAHALLHSWLPDYSDEEIAAIIQVCLSSKIENAGKNFERWQSSKKELLGGGKPYSIENCLVLVNREIKAGFDEKVLGGILGKEEQVVIKYDDNVGNVAVNLAKMRKTVLNAYGNSESIVAEKLKQLPGYYTRPVTRLASYIDGTAFSTVIA